MKIISLQLWFGRSSPVVRAFEIIGFGLAAAVVFQAVRTDWMDAAFYFYLFFLFQWFLVIIFVLIRWYPEQGRGIGIEVNFQRMRVPAAYLTCLTPVMYLSGLRWTAVIVANLVMLAINAIQFILVWFHFHDKETLPINYLSHSKYKGDSPLCDLGTDHVFCLPCSAGGQGDLSPKHSGTVSRDVQ